MSDRTTGDWEALLDGTTPAPWRWQWDRGILAITGTNGEAVAIDADIKDSEVLAAAPEAVAEVVRLRRELEEFLRELNDDLYHEGIEDYGDIDDAWPSMQEYGELTVKLAHRNILTRILEGGNDD